MAIVLRQGLGVRTTAILSAHGQTQYVQKPLRNQDKADRIAMSTHAHEYGKMPSRLCQESS